MKRIVLAGGCFWGVEAYYKKLKGVINTNVGYANGNIEFPTYEDLKSGKANHVEAVEIYYNEEVISLEKMLEHLFRFIDPTSLNKQGADVGIQYRTGIYYRSADDKQIIDKFISEMNKKYNNRVVVEVEEERGFYLAEDYHQDYLDIHPNGYCHVNFDLIKDEEKK